MNYELTISQKGILSGVQMQALEILNFNNQELSEFLTTEYLENPLIESSNKKEDHILQNLEHMYENNPVLRNQYSGDMEEDENKKEVAKKEDAYALSQSLMEQLNAKNYTEEEWRLMTDLTYALDEKGFFTFAVSDISAALHYPEDLVERCLQVLKSLEPVGIFSKDISECLTMQLRHKGIEDPDLYRIIDQYMDELLAGHISDITRALGISSTRIREYIHLIGILNPRPIMNAEEGMTEFVMPDVIVEDQDGQWNIQLNDKWMSDYHYNDYYIGLMRKAQDPELKEYFSKKYKRARFIFDSIEQRRNTIIKVTQIILEMQDGYFRRKEPLAPMTMEDIAQRLDMHASTVSRAIKGKYLQYHSVILMKDLFSNYAGTQKSDGTKSVSTDAIKHQIRQIIRDENPKKPYSDQKIADLLAKEGIVISKRTVTKYRQQEGILDSRQRKIYQ